MDIRTYRPQDEAPLLRLWNDCLTEDALDAANFRQRVIYDVNFDPENLLVAEEDGTLTGFVYAVCRKVADEVAGLQAGQGWIVAMGVAPGCRRKGTGRLLLAAAEEKLAAAGVTAVGAGPYASNYIFPGVDVKAYAEAVEFFAAMGYEKNGECCSMDIGLRGYTTPQKYRDKQKKLEAEGYRFALYTPADALPLFDFLDREFPHWKPDVRRAIQAGRAEDTLILAHGPAGDIVGFVLRAMDGTAERFGPFGTMADLQGIGLGTVLFHLMMENLVGARVFYTYFLWTGGRNLDIYGTWGMKIYRTYAMMNKTL